MKILVKNYPIIASSIEYPNIDILYFGFYASQRCRKAVEEYKDMENNFYSNNAPNDNL